LLLVTACSAIDGAPDVITSPATSAPPGPAPTATPADTGWVGVGEGIEIREQSITYRDRRDRLYLARVDPARASFQVAYDPRRPRRVWGWIEDEDARLVINGGFFDPENRALGLLIADGYAFGETYVGLGGLFGVQAGRVQIRSLILEPFQSGEVFDQMVQSYPTLLVGDGVINAEIRDDGRRSTRSVIGLDRAGRVVFLLSPRATFNLVELAEWLAQSDLDLDTALNLDGGASAGLVARTPDGAWGVNSWATVPAVILAR
jgi:hypothetical protein